MVKPDTETQKVMEDQQKVRDFVKSDGWGIVRGIYAQRVADLISVHNINENLSPEQMVIEVGARKLALQTLNEFMSEVEGISEQSEQTKGLFAENNDDYVEVYED